MAEIHALLFISVRPLCTDDIMVQLQISRGNASMNLRALVDWGLIERVHKLGDRREYFQADTDVWRMFETIMRERRRREVEPIIATIDRCCATLEVRAGVRSAAEASEATEMRRRLESLRAFLSTMGALFELVLQFRERGASRLAQAAAGSGRSRAGRSKRSRAGRNRALRVRETDG
jgi:DNA-binding transcriptional regulator GbsR (MarR family)